MLNSYCMPPFYDGTQQGEEVVSTSFNHSTVYTLYEYIHHVKHTRYIDRMQSNDFQL